MKTSDVLVLGVFALITGTCLSLVLSMVNEKQVCDSAIQQQLKQLKRDSSAKMEDLSTACATPIAHAVDRLINTK